MDYDEYIGDKALDDLGEKKWNKRMEKVFQSFKNSIQLRPFIYRRRQCQKLETKAG
jgi:hypothetical protein